MLLVAGCAAGSAELDTHVSLRADYQRLKDRLALRGDSTRTASYRVRWRAQGIEPHAEMILRIDYRAPNRFHIAGKGPLDVPVFTAWVVDSQFVLVDHQEGRTRSGRLDEFWDEEVPEGMPSFGTLLALLSGGCGVRLPDSIHVDDLASRDMNPADFAIVDDAGRTLVLDVWKSRLKRILWQDAEKGERVDGEVRFGGFSDGYPFWKLHSGRWVNPHGPGEYRWEVLAQKFNHELPEHLFTPPTER